MVNGERGETTDVRGEAGMVNWEREERVKREVIFFIVESAGMPGLHWAIRDLVCHFHCLDIKHTIMGKIKKRSCCQLRLWAHSGLNQGPPDYESGALTS